MSQQDTKASIVFDFIVLLVLMFLFTYGVYEIYQLVITGVIPINLDLFERLTN